MNSINNIRVTENPITVKDLASDSWKVVPEFSIAVETKETIFYVKRYIPDCYNFDQLVKAHYPKIKLPLPSLTENTSRTQRILGFFQIHTKTNAEKLEKYLHQCSADPILESSSLLRDFLSPQREDDYTKDKASVAKSSHSSYDQLVPTSRSIPHNSNSEPITQDLEKSFEYDGNQMETSNCSISLLNNNNSLQSFTSDSLSIVEVCSIHVDGNTSKAIGTTFYDVFTHPIPNSATESSFPLDHFELVKVLGKGCMGKVLLVKSKKTSKLYALKSIIKNYVIEQREIVHTLDEKTILSKISEINHPYLAKLHTSFQDEHRLYLLTNYYCGGDLAMQMTKCYKFPPEYALFFAAEIIEGIGELHRLGILYRDLKPENILLTGDGHIVLTDFGLGKCLNESTNYTATTFCGTAEYLAPEVILGEPYSFGVDHWSFGTILYEMLAGVPPFWDDNHDTMYQRILQDPLRFPPENFDYEVTEFLIAILDRDPRTRLGAHGVDEIKNHMYFAEISWDDIRNRKALPPYIPTVTGEIDFSNFDAEFITMPPALTPISSGIEYSGEFQDVFDEYSFVDDKFYDQEPIYKKLFSHKKQSGEELKESTQYQREVPISYQGHSMFLCDYADTGPNINGYIDRDISTEYSGSTTPNSNLQQNETSSITAFDYLDLLQSPDLRLSFHMDQEHHVIKDNDITPILMDSSITDDTDKSKFKGFFSTIFTSNK